MPKIRATPQQRREKALMVAVARAKAERDLETDLAVADLIGLGSKNYSNHKKAAFQHLNLETFSRMARMLGLTGREICAAVGVPYEERSEEH